MRVVWKDSTIKGSPIKYRGYRIWRYRNGWITDYPNDKHIYCAIDDARNMLTSELCGQGEHVSTNRLDGRIRVVGEHDEYKSKKEEGLS